MIWRNEIFIHGWNFAKQFELSEKFECKDVL